MNKKQVSQQINGTTIAAYVGPELENLSAIFNNFHLCKSLKALILLQSIFELEIMELHRCSCHPKKE